MNRFFRRVSLAAKLLLIGLVPLAFIIFLTVRLYNEKEVKVNILKGYIDGIHQLRNTSLLIDNMQKESKLSFDFAVRGAAKEPLIRQGLITDSIVKLFNENRDILSQSARGYTNLGKLQETRNEIDSGKASNFSVISYYSTTVFWLNTLTGVTLSNNNPMEPAFADLRAQKLMAEIITYLSIISTNIYNVLHTQQFANEILQGSAGAYEVYKSYHEEFLSKASPASINTYKNILANTELKAANEYIDRLFTTRKFDSTYNADQWWEVSDKGIDHLSALQENIWNSTMQIANDIYSGEIRNKYTALILLTVFIIIVIAIVAYTIFVISSMLRELKQAAVKISNGITGTQFNNFPNDAIGSLAESITRIDQNYQQLAIAADAIGKKNFNIPVHARSDQDLLGNAIVQMKKDLQEFSDHMENLVAERTEELRKSNESLQEFAHVTSHDLKEPLRKIIMFTQKLEDENANTLVEGSRKYIQKVQEASGRMSAMVEGVLEYAAVNGIEDHFIDVDLNNIFEGIKSDLELLILDKQAIVQIEKLPVVKGIPVLLHQLFFNLVSNALKFSKSDRTPQIIVTASPVNERDLIHLQLP